MEKQVQSHELLVRAMSAWPCVFGLPVAVIGAWTFAVQHALAPGPEKPWPFVLAGLVSVVAFVCVFGFFIVTPNHSRVLVLFGRYRGTVREAGFYWTNPFTSKRNVSLRAHNVASEKIKV